MSIPANATGTAPGSARPWARWLLLGTLYLAGAAHWTWLFGTAAEPFRGPSFTREDWPKEYLYYSILQQALREGEVPYFISRPIHTRRFLSLPEVNWSPQILLLRVLDVGPFILVHTLLLYSAGFAGLLLLKRHLALGPLPFAFLFLVFNFNGHLTAHLAVGHSMWAAHFLFPFLLLGTLRLLEEPGDRRTPLALALALFLVLLQGGFHAFVWWVFVLGLLAVFDLSTLRPVVATLAWAGLLSACRLLPAAFLIRRMRQSFLSGFPGASELWHGLVSLVPATAARRGGLFDTLNWWEIDHYVGPVGLAWLVYFGILRSWRGRPGARAGLAGPLLVFFLLSLGDLYAPINALPIPLLSAERVSTRFILLPLLFVAVLAASQMEAWLRERPSRARTALGIAGAVLLALSLGAHSRLWRLESLEEMLPARKGRLEIGVASLPEPPDWKDLAYVGTVRSSAVLSAGAIVLLLIRLRRALRDPSAAAQTSSAFAARS